MKPDILISCVEKCLLTTRFTAGPTTMRLPHMKKSPELRTVCASDARLKETNPKRFDFLASSRTTLASITSPKHEK